jgi:uroporphyrin-III C-methyltransferase/precorrin-2 dehydrogenase/sirohydrochlorin ferrochelatase
MQPLATLPLFHKLDGAPVLLAGQGTEALVWKAELLAAAGARVIIATETAEAFAAVQGAVEIHTRA